MLRYILTVTCALWLVVPVFALEEAAPPLEQGAEIDCAHDVRPVVTTIFEQGEVAGLSLQQMVAQAIEVGPNLCGVLMVAAERGYDPAQVLQALLDANISRDVLARDALDAGYDRQIIAEVLYQNESEGLGFTPSIAQGPAALSPPTGVGGGSRGASVSPSSF